MPNERNLDFKILSYPKSCIEQIAEKVFEKASSARLSAITLASVFLAPVAKSHCSVNVAFERKCQIALISLFGKAIQDHRTHSKNQTRASAVSAPLFDRQPGTYLPPPLFLSRRLAAFLPRPCSRAPPAGPSAFRPWIRQARRGRPGS
jgi:hypothetical protein